MSHCYCFLKTSTWNMASCWPPVLLDRFKAWDFCFRKGVLRKTEYQSSQISVILFCPCAKKYFFAQGQKSTVLLFCPCAKKSRQDLFFFSRRPKFSESCNRSSGEEKLIKLFSTNDKLSGRGAFVWLQCNCISSCWILRTVSGIFLLRLFFPVVKQNIPILFCKNQSFEFRINPYFKIIRYEVYRSEHSDACHATFANESLWFD